MTAAEYVKRKEILLYTPGILKNGVLYAVYEGKEIPDKEFRKMFKLPDRIWSNPENPCKKVAAIS